MTHTPFLTRKAIQYGMHSTILEFVFSRLEERGLAVPVGTREAIAKELEEVNRQPEPRGERPFEIG